MRIKTTRGISPSNINLAIVDNAKIYSDQAIEISRYSDQYQENLVPIFSEYVRTSTKLYLAASNQSQRSVYIADISVLSDDFMITNEVIFDKNTLSTTPLWYTYELDGYYINRSTTGKQITRTLVDNVINNLIPENSKEIPAIDSSFYIRPVMPNGTLLDILNKSAYRVDVNNNRIVVTNPNTIALFNGYTFQITMRTIVPEISVVYADGTAVPSNLYRINFETYTSNMDSLLKDVYVAKILMSDIENTALIQVTYEKYLDVVSDKLVSETATEIVNPRRLFRNVAGTSDNARDIISEDEFSYVFDTYIFSAISPKEDFFIKYTNVTGEKIALQKPEGMTIEFPWYIDVVPNMFTRDALTYDVIERNRYTFRDNFRIAHIFESATRVSSTMLKLHNKNIYSAINSAGDITGIDLYIDGYKRNSFIADVDAQNGILLLSREIGANQLISTQYSYYTNSIPYIFVNMNPSNRFNDNSSIIQKIMVMFMLPTEELNTVYGRSIFHLLIQKYPTMTKDLAPYEISIDAANEFITGIDTLGVSNLFSIIPDYIKVGAGPILHPIILGAVTVNPTKTEQSVNLVDIRNRGGGIVENSVVEDANWAAVRNYMDIGFWDGIKLNTANIIVVDIPQSAVDKVQNRLALFDMDILRDPTNTQLLSDKTYATIQAAVTKYTPVAKHVELRYYQD